MSSDLTLLHDGPESGPTIVLAHGAGAPMSSPFMTDIAYRLGSNGFRVVRFNFPYMAERELTGKKRPPNGQKVLLETWSQVIDSLGGATDLVIGGKSMGGRMASMIADEYGVRGLICLGYPFHAPGKQDKPRVTHLEAITTPTLICQGMRDSMGNTDTVSGYNLSPAIRLHWSEDGDHSLKPRVKSGRTLDQNLTTASNAITNFMNTLFQQ